MHLARNSLNHVMPQQIAGDLKPIYLSRN
ncbi:MAG: hypothetical protein PHE96_03200 [Methylococcales bacterium]|nr:hypothetical protein [Methylococcales bacterium]